MLATASLAANAEDDLFVTQNFSFHLYNPITIGNDTVPIIFDKNVASKSWSTGAREASALKWLPADYTIKASDKNSGGVDIYAFSLWVPTNVTQTEVTYARLNGSIFFKREFRWSGFATIRFGWKQSDPFQVLEYLKNSEDTPSERSLMMSAFGSVSESYVTPISTHLSLWFATIGNRVQVRWASPTTKHDVWESVTNYTVPGSEVVCKVGTIYSSCYNKLVIKTTTSSTQQRFQNTENKSILVKKPQ